MNPFLATAVTLLIVTRAYFNRSLTVPGILAAILTAAIHASYPLSLPFALMGVFFIAGTAVTKVKHNVKERLTVSADGGGGGGTTGGGEGKKKGVEGGTGRNHVQVFANSGAASLLILADLWFRKKPGTNGSWEVWEYDEGCFGRGELGDVLLVGIICNYAATCADTFSSELGILSRSAPRLITSPSLRRVPPGTNGGVSLAGTMAGFGGALIIALTALVLLPFCSSSSSSKNTGLFGSEEAASSWSATDKLSFVLFITAWGGLGSLLDSILGATLQASVVDRRSGRVVEGRGGVRVLVHPVRQRASGHGDDKKHDDKDKKGGESGRFVVSGMDVLDNNGVNLLMAVIMSFGGALAAARWWGVGVGL